MSVDIMGLLEWRRDLQVAAARIVPEAEQVASRAALKIKAGMRASAAAATPKGYARRLPLSITYDVTAGIGRVEAEVGPDKARPGLQGALGNFLAFGSRNNAPVWDYTVPLAAEAPVVEKFLGLAGQRLLS